MANKSSASNANHAALKGQLYDGTLHKAVRSRFLAQNQKLCSKSRVDRFATTTSIY